MEHISRLKICYLNIAYTFKRKRKCSVPPHEILPISIAGQYCNALFAYCFRSRKRVQRYETISNRQIIYDNSRSFAVIHVEKRPRYSCYSCHSCSEKRWCGYPCLASPAIGLQKVFKRSSKGPRHTPGWEPMEPRCRHTVAPVALRRRSVPAPTVHRLFNGFWSERGRSGVGEDGYRRLAIYKKKRRHKASVVV